MQIILLLFVLALSGCATTDVTPASTGSAAPNTSFMYDLSGSVNGVAFNGVGVIPKAASYNMKIVSSVDVDLLTITSCARDFSAQSAIKIGWFESKRGYNYQYVPAPGIEDVDSCLVRFGAYNEGKGANAWGLIDFESPNRTLPAQQSCNGGVQQTNGVSICQSRTGLLQNIKFPGPVIASQKIPAACMPTSTDGGITWNYAIAPGECVMEFAEIAQPHRRHRHTTVSYTTVQIRSGQ